MKTQKSFKMPQAPTIPATPARPALFRRIYSSGTSLFRDNAICYGIKFGLAGVLAVFIALVLRLQNPTWALFTVYVLMIAQYVGAIAEKSFFRVIGTVVGGVLGYLLTAGLEQSPILFLTLTGLVVGVSTAMFGQSRYPYAFLLCGLTTVVVTSNGLGNPDQSWQYMLWRIEEVGVGIIATILVQCLVFPRYAREEFIRNSQASFADLRDCFAVSSRIVLEGGNTVATVRAEGFPARISALRALLDFGGRESQHFRDRQTTYFGITSCLSNIAAAIATMGRSLPPNSLYRSSVGDALVDCHKALTTALDGLSRSQSPEQRKAHRDAAEQAFAIIEKKMADFRQMPEVFTVAPEEVLTMGLQMLALDDIRQQIQKAHSLLDSLPEDPADHSRDQEPFVSPLPPSFWIKSGIKSAIAVTSALLIDNWFNPPGGSMFVLGAWVFTALNATSPGGQGDRRTFHYAGYNTLALLGMSLLLILSSPMLSSYAVMNTYLFTWLFVWGYLSYSVRGMTIPMQVGMLISVGVLGLNGQQPVDFQAIVGFFFGMVLALFLAAIVQRLFWPSLPQWEMRNRFVEFAQTCIYLVKNGTDKVPLWRKVRLALIPGEIDQRIKVLEHPSFPDGESQRLREYLLSLQKVGNHLVATLGKLDPLLPANQVEKGKTLIHDFESEIITHLEAHAKSMSTTTELALDTSPLSLILTKWQAWLKETRVWMVENKYPVRNAVRIYGYCGRYEQMGQDLLKADTQARELRTPLYMGDTIL